MDINQLTALGFKDRGGCNCNGGTRRFTHEWNEGVWLSLVGLRLKAEQQTYRINKSNRNGQKLATGKLQQLNVQTLKVYFPSLKD